jgi:hypothetical protein
MAATLENNFFPRVREAGMSDIVQQGCKSEDLSPFRHRLAPDDLDFGKSGLEQIASLGGEVVKRPSCHLHNAKAVLKPGVSRPRIDKFSERKLPDET